MNAELSEAQFIERALSDHGRHLRGDIASFFKESTA